MVFKRLEMQGFKSFADRVVIEFHEGITCIVGPNGSGKSNISDAIRWVLGEQSPRALRGGKMEEVIFAGTAGRKPRGMAEVVLVIDNEGRDLPIDFSEVAITRRMYRSGESEYSINGNPCRLRDIRNLIMDTGIGVDGYSIIGQGKIADIVSNKPESRREIFEEAAGVVLYKTRRQEAEKKLESTSLNLERVNDILAEIAGRIDNLQTESDKAKKYLELKERYEALETNIILHQIDAAELNLEVYADDLLLQDGEIRKLTQELQTLDEETLSLTRERDGTENDGTTKREELLQTVSALHAASGREDLRTERLSGLAKEKDILERDIENSLTKKKEEEENAASLQKEREEREEKVRTFRENLEESVKDYNEHAARQAELLAHVDACKARRFDLDAEQKGIRAKEDGMESLKGNLLARRSELEGEPREEEEENASEAEAQVTQAEKQKAEAEKALAVTSAEIKETEKQIDAIRAERQEKALKSSSLAGRRRMMQEMDENYEGYTYAVKALMKEKLPGVIGVAASLMTVSAGLETAIETALGGSLQNVVCKGDADAKEGVRILKKKKAGRLTFLPLSSVHGRAANPGNGVANDPGFKGIASALISFAPQYRGIFDYLLGRVAVVEDMDSAIRLSKKGEGLRFVTLSGEVVSPSGAITGGTYKHKSAGILSRQNELKALKKELAAIEEEIDSLDKKEKKALKRRAALEQDRDEKRRALSGAESAFDRARLSLTAARERRAAADVRAERRDRELADISARLADAEKSTSSAAARSAAIADELAALETEASAAVKAYESAKDETARASEEVTGARILLTREEAAQDALQKMIARSSEALTSLAAHLKEREAHRAALEEEERKLHQEAGSTEEREALEEKKKNLEELLRQLDIKKESISRKLEEQAEVKRSKTAALNDARDARYQIELKRSKAEDSVAALKQKLWDEFEISFAQAQDRRDPAFVYSAGQRENRALRASIRELGDVNVGAIAEYREVEARYDFLNTQKEDIEKAKEELLSIISGMDRDIKKRFKENFDQVADHFKNVFAELFGGGQADLRLEQEEDPLNSGIEIVAQPPGKKLRNINLMSGGEKTMTAIALMFAVLKTKPTPFCILDEVEAALDDVNIDRFADYLRHFSGIQFALVTHQRETMEHADVLYGVTMPERGISKVLSLRLADDFDLSDSASG